MTISIVYLFQIDQVIVLSNVLVLKKNTHPHSSHFGSQRCAAFQAFGNPYICSRASVYGTIAFGILVVAVACLV